MQRCSTYNGANFARRRDCQSNSHILIGGKFVKKTLLGGHGKARRTVINITVISINMPTVPGHFQILLICFRQQSLCLGFQSGDQSVRQSASYICNEMAFVWVMIMPAIASWAKRSSLQMII